VIARSWRYSNKLREGFWCLNCSEHMVWQCDILKWLSKYGGMDTSMIARFKELEEENRQLKKMYAEERLESE